ncbi:reprolysin-like metallopeptidase, partial [Dokdonella sp.]|uniref:reprolysin-like metallopeptidase n=1 Tax=Dokdonella sp. TaxID=2291710 RepID=UPI0025C5A6A4
MNPSIAPSLKAVMTAMCLLWVSNAWAGPSRSFWQEDAGRGLAKQAPQPSQFRALDLDLAQVADYLKQAHAQGIAASIELPQPEGGFADFLVVDSGTMPEELQRKYPEIRSFKGSDAQGRMLRLDVSPLGLQAMVFDAAGTWVVRPEIFGSGSHYLSYRRSALPESARSFGQCGTQGSDLDSFAQTMGATQPMTQTGVTRRVYRAAVAANHQYIAAVGGGTVEGGLAATIVAVNRVTQIYEYEMSIQLVLVPNNDLLMYASASGDPFTANDGSFLNSATATISGVIGVGNYDIGHVFSTGSGGVAGLGVVCKSGSKGRGTTGMGNPTGDAFYVDYVAHEMGHQFGGNHPFNGTIGNCSGGNRNGSTAYEPGSGSTIMAYAGICGADDLQPNSDPYFHAISLQEITNYTNGGGNCSVNTANANQLPMIDSGSLPSGYTIPSRTPFMLTGSASDADSGDAVRYSWEEWDLGAAAPLSAGDNGSSPIFRAFSPTYSGTRVFPSLSTVLGGPALKGETLPTTTRTLKFRLTARDMHNGRGTSSSADISVGVVSAAGPFKVTAPNTAVSWPQGSAQTVTWDVANTTAAPVSCANVDISLSADGGYTFPYVLASGVANSGSASVSMPMIATTRGRVAVTCASNIFFDISDANFTIPAAAGTYTVGGSVSGLVGSGLSLTLNGNPMAVASNGAYAFPMALATGAVYAVTIGNQPILPGQICAVSDGSGTIASANVLNINVSCVTTPAATYTVGGTISGLLGSGLSLQINGGSPVPMSSNGPYSFPPLVDGSPYHVRVVGQPSGPTQSCSVANYHGTLDGASVNNVDVTCTGGPATYSVGGNVSGLTGAGLVLWLNAGAQSLPVSANGAFTFPTGLLGGANYAVTVGTQPAGQLCSVSNGSGTIGSANVTNVAVSCAAIPTYTVGGNVSGLTGAGLVLSLNAGAQSLPVAADGAFTFPTGLTGGASYAVTVGTQPAGQVCNVSNGSGTIGSANVTDVAVTCTVAS